jgi:hypothetical protein
MFQRIYDSAWHHPGLCWIAGAPLLVFLCVRLAMAGDGERRFLGALLVAFQIEIVLDAWLTGGLTPLTATAATVAAIVFVVLGDLRFFVVRERYGHDARRGLGRALPRALGWSLLVPIGQRIAVLIVPRLGAELRYVFLSYEVMFALLAVVLLLLVVRSPSITPAIRAWMTRLVVFELVQYALWATADVVILTGADAGFLLRLVPNAMYYAAFVPFVWLTAPAELRP